MQLGAYFLPVDFDTYLPSVKAADEAGYSHAWIPDSVMIWEDPYVYMARGLADTENLVFGTAVTNPVTRHYTATAAAHTTLAQMHPDRVILGLGRGDSSIRTLGLRPAKIKEMRTIVPDVRALAAGASIEVNEKKTRITWARSPDLPLMLGGSGPKTLRLAGSLADLVTIEVGMHPDSIEWAIGNIRQGAEEAGRDPAAVKVIALCGMWVGDDAEEAREHCRWAPASAINLVAEVMRNTPGHGMPASLTGLIEKRRSLVAAPAGSHAPGVPSLDGTYDYEEHCVNDADHATWLPDEDVDQFILAGDADSIIERAADLADLGVHQIAAAFLNGEGEQMRRVGREVIPRLAEIAV